LLASWQPKGAVDGSRVNAVAPWCVLAQRSEPALAGADYLDEMLERMPLIRVVEP
jgi:Tropinone reductase 1